MQRGASILTNEIVNILYQHTYILSINVQLNKLKHYNDYSNDIIEYNFQLTWKFIICDCIAVWIYAVMISQENVHLPVLASANTWQALKD